MISADAAFLVTYESGRLAAASDMHALIERLAGEAVARDNPALQHTLAAAREAVLQEQARGTAALTAALTAVRKPYPRFPPGPARLDHVPGWRGGIGTALEPLTGADGALALRLGTAAAELVRAWVASMHVAPLHTAHPAHHSITAATLRLVAETATSWQQLDELLAAHPRPALLRRRGQLALQVGSSPRPETTLAELTRWLDSLENQLRQLAADLRLGETPVPLPPAARPTPADHLSLAPVPSIIQLVTAGAPAPARLPRHDVSLAGVILVDLPAITRAAIALVTPLARATPDAIAAALKPRDEDYAQVFIGQAATLAREGYASLWASPPDGLAKPGQTIVTGSAAQAQTLATDSEPSRQFPGGYRRIAHLLTPNVVWVRWDYRAPTADSGMAYDGLVQLGERWAWFPKPWRIIDTAS